MEKFLIIEGKSFLGSATENIFKIIKEIDAILDIFSLKEN